MDKDLLEFVSNNWLTISFCLGVLKGVAKITPWAKDDQIIQVFSGALDALKGVRKQ